MSIGIRTLKRSSDEITPPPLISGGGAIDWIVKSYKTALYYHGTSKTSAESIREYGMLIRKKTRGCTAIIKDEYGLDDRAASKHQYVMSRSSACAYAKMHPEPELVRLILPPEVFSLTLDPEAAPGEKEYRLQQDIPPSFILPSHRKSLKTEQLKAINKAFNFTPLSKREFKELKHRVRHEILAESKSDHQVMALTKSFVEQEKERFEKDLHKLYFMGINLSDLKEGDVFSLPT
jgi:hypothetical protein